jgi:hypothetical protein
MKALMCLLVLSFAVSTLAKETAPLPEKIMQAKTVFVENQTKDAQIGDAAFRELSKWKRYVLVADESKADLVFVLTEATHEAVYSNPVRVSNQVGMTTITTGGQVYSYTTGSVTLEIQDAEGTVWANTKPFSRKGATKDLINDLKDRIKRQEKARRRVKVGGN